ncbi:MAG: DUF4010 domain-containing protein [Acidobacteria bacterium]|nr:MAG: DUF4010 domain-containing protein [Acidobacteriota bacterium]
MRSDADSGRDPKGDGEGTWKLPFGLGLTVQDRGVLWRYLLLLAALPLLPTATFGPYSVLSARQIGWMVVLIVSVNLCGYLMLRLFGARAGFLLAGLLGGLISSTAVAIAYARDTRTMTGVDRIAALAIAAATAVSLVRVPLELFVVARSQLLALWLPFALLFLATLVGPTWLWLRGEVQDLQEVHPPKNPAQLGTALLFGLLYAGVLVGSAAAKDRLGEGGLYALAAVSGFTDLDAITLSTGRLLADGRLELAVGCRAVIVAVLANQLFKLAMIVALASPRARRLLLVAFAPTVVACGVLLVPRWG